MKATPAQDTPLTPSCSHAGRLPVALPPVVRHHLPVDDGAPQAHRRLLPLPRSITQAPMRWRETSEWRTYESGLQQGRIQAVAEALQITARGGDAPTVFAERLRQYEQSHRRRDTDIIAEHIQRAASRSGRPVPLRTAMIRLGSSTTHPVNLKRCAVLQPCIFKGIRAGKTWRAALAPFDLPPTCLPGQTVVLIQREIVHGFGLKLFDASGSVRATAEVLGLDGLGVEHLEEWVVQHRGAGLLAKAPHAQVAGRLQLGAAARRQLQEIAAATMGLAQIKRGSNCDEVAAALALDPVGKQHLQKQAAITAGVQRVLSAGAGAPVLDDLQLGHPWNAALLQVHARRAGDLQSPPAQVHTDVVLPTVQRATVTADQALRLTCEPGKSTVSWTNAAPLLETQADARRASLMEKIRVLAVPLDQALQRARGSSGDPDDLLHYQDLLSVYVALRKELSSVSVDAEQVSNTCAY